MNWFFCFVFYMVYFFSLFVYPSNPVLSMNEHVVNYDIKANATQERHHVVLSDFLNIGS